ncbi:MAG: response regulator [Vallitaleaceae bacterium]|nr:response regulator [Vallitaleaceae bacterium]
MNTIMIVDDEPMITKTLSVLLKMKTKQNIISFNTPLEALHSEEMKAKKVDVILSDFIMPDMNGIEFLLEVKKITPHTETILLTGYADKENAIRSINEVGVYYYLEKPWDNEELVKIVNNALEKKTLATALEQKMNELSKSNQENRRLYELVSKDYSQAVESTKGIMISLANVIEAKDSYTDGHTRRVAQVASALGEAFSLSPEDIECLQTVGIIHDIGKIGIAESILNKPAKLTDEEFEIMKSHPVIGEKICRPLPFFEKYLGPIRHHHEKLDGSGYPDGLKGQEIDLITRILAVADIFDALYSERPYRKQLPIDQVEDIMKLEVEKGFIDRDVVQMLFRLIKQNRIDFIGQE